MTAENTADIGPIRHDETVSRFILYSKYIRADGTVKGQLFQDSRNPAEISVVRTDSLNNDQIWEIAEEHMPRSVHGRASILVSNAERNPFLQFKQKEIDEIVRLANNIEDISEITIKVVAAPDTHPYHANITYTPFHKAIVMHITDHLAEQSTLHRRDQDKTAASN